MDRTPYAPPNAPVDDVVQPVLTRPPQVVWAVRLLFCNFVLAMLLGLLDFRNLLDAVRRTPSSVATDFATIFLILLPVTWVVVITQIYRRRNWARVVFLLLVGLHVVALVVDWRNTLTTYQTPAPKRVIVFSEDVIDAVCVFLLLTPIASTWFRGSRPQPGTPGR